MHHAAAAGGGPRRTCRRETVISMGDPSTAYIVQGYVRRADRSPVSAARVRVYAWKLRNERQLAEATTDADGYYQAAFDMPGAGPPGNPRPDLVVRAFDPDDAPIAISSIRFDAGHLETIDLVPDVSAGRPSE